MLGGSDDAETVTRERLGIKLQTDVHILTCGGAETLTRSLRRIDVQYQRHIAILPVSRRIHQSGSTLCLQQTFAHSPVKALAIFPHGLFAIECPRELSSIGGFEAIRLPGVWQ